MSSPDANASCVAWFGAAARNPRPQAEALRAFLVVGNTLRARLWNISSVFRVTSRQGAKPSFEAAAIHREQAVAGAALSTSDSRACRGWARPSAWISSVSLQSPAAQRRCRSLRRDRPLKIQRKNSGSGNKCLRAIGTTTRSLRNWVRSAKNLI